MKFDGNFVKRSTNIYFVILYLAIKSEYAFIGLSQSLKTLR